MTENSANGPASPSFTPPSGGGKTRLIAIIVAIVIVVSVGGFAAYELVQKPTTSVTKSSNQAVSIEVNFHTALKSVAYNFGDMQSGTITSSGVSHGVYADLSSGLLYLNHTYSEGGTFVLSVQPTYTNGTVGPIYEKQLVTVSPNLISSTESAGLLAVNTSASTGLISTYTSNNIFTPGAKISVLVGYFTEPSNSSYQVYKQVVTPYFNGTAQSSQTFNYGFYQGSYVLNTTNATMTINTPSKSTFVVAAVDTYTGLVNATTGAVSNSTSILTYYDYLTAPSSEVAVLPVVSHPSKAHGTFTNAELETGGFRTLDPQIAYDTVSDEILANTYQQLTIYNGSDVSGYSPYLAAFLPTPGHGINIHYHNYTVKATKADGASGNFNYAVNVTPGENYTWTIRSNATFQNGAPVTAYDVYYSLVRDLLFTSNANNPGWIIAQYLLPGNYYASNTYYNITQNLTYNNASNTVTMHFQKPMAEALVYQIFYTSGTYITSAQWLIEHGAGITFTPAGFTAYEAQGYPSGYNTYVQFHVDANGPYTIFSVSQSAKVVLEANPNFTSPNKWVLYPSYKYVVIEYIAEASTTYLDLESGASQAAGIPTSSWNEVQGLVSAGKVHETGGPSISILWYNFNANVNLTVASASTPGINMPFDMFTSIHARRAFAFAYPHNFYLNQDVGNALFHTKFASNYAGMIPDGMIGGVPFSQLNNSANQSWISQDGISYNLAAAQANWNTFLKNWNNNPNISKLGMTITKDSSGDYIYKGAKLDIPIYIFSADPVDLNGATAWGSNLSKIITGASFPVIPTAFPTLLGNQVQGQNPMPVYLLGWLPDYPFPTDYLNPMANPLNSTTYPGPNDFTPWWFGYNTSNPYHNTTEAMIMKQMLADYSNGTKQVSTSAALKYFWMENRDLINMTYYVYTEQAYEFLILSTTVNFTQAETYQMNTVWFGGYYLYNDFVQASS